MSSARRVPTGRLARVGRKRQGRLMVEKPLRGTLNPFEVPTGPLGRLAGWIMGRDDTAHREVVELLRPEPGAASCEIGCGPGQLLVLLAARDPRARIRGVDPSPVMLTQ